MKQTSSICPVWEAAHPQLRWRAGWESRCPGVQGMPMGCSVGGRGAGAGGCPPCLSWPPPQQPLDTARCLLPGQGLSPDLLSTPGSLHKSVKETWGVQNSGGKNSFLGKRRKQNKPAKPQTRILRWAETCDTGSKSDSFLPPPPGVIYFELFNINKTKTVLR